MAERGDLDEAGWTGAGEYALGVLEGEELATARRRALSDGAFADAAQWWSLRFGRLGELAGPVIPPAGTWSAIDRRIDIVERQPDGPATLRPAAAGRPAGWSIALAVTGAGLAAAALALFLATPDPATIPAPAPGLQSGERLLAQLASEEGDLRLASVVELDRDRIVLTTEGLAPGAGQSAELWVVPEGGSPTSLGLIPSTGRFVRQLDPAERELLVEGASLAVTIEDVEGAPHAAPSTPILLIGPLDRV